MTETVLAVDPKEVKTLARMAHLRRLVRDQGLDAEAAAREVGVDPIIAQLWLRLPDDLWPRSAEEQRRTVDVAPQPTPRTRWPCTQGLRRVVACRVPLPAYELLRVGPESVMQRAADALRLALFEFGLPSTAAGTWWRARRPLAVPLDAEDYGALIAFAHPHFNDERDAAGWLIARGLGMALPLPTAAELAGPLRLAPGAPRIRLAATFPPATEWRSADARALARMQKARTAHDEAGVPSGAELAKRRTAVGLTQRNVAEETGLSRGLVAEIERGRRRHVLSRQRIAQVLAGHEARAGRTAGA